MTRTPMYELEVTPVFSCQPADTASDLDHPEEDTSVHTLTILDEQHPPCRTVLCVEPFPSDAGRVQQRIVADLL